VPMDRTESTLLIASWARDGALLSCDSTSCCADKDAGDSVICTAPTDDLMSIGRWYEEEVTYKFVNCGDYVILHGGFKYYGTRIIEDLEEDMMDLRAANVKVDFACLGPRLATNFNEKLRQNTNDPVATERIRNTAFFVAALSKKGKLKLRSYSFSDIDKCLKYSNIKEFDCVGSGAPWATTILGKSWNKRTGTNALFNIHHKAMKAANNVEASVGGIHTYIKVKVNKGKLDIKVGFEPIVDLYRILKLEKNSVNDQGLEISKLGIEDRITKTLAKRGISVLYPIQRFLLELVKTGRDIIGRARTGTGKTLAFGIPIMDKILKFNAKHGKRRDPLALVLVPTRELARQVEQEFHVSTRDLDTLYVCGAVPRRMTTGAVVDVVVGTPESIVYLLKRDELKLCELQFLVLLEADKMHSLGFNEEMITILLKPPSSCQTIISARATMSPGIWNLTQNYLRRPIAVDLVGNSTQYVAASVQLFKIEAEMGEEAAVIVYLIREYAEGDKKTIVFTKTETQADELVSFMRQRNCMALYEGGNERKGTLSGFRGGAFNILVATDVAASGLDVPSVNLVIHYGPSATLENFVLRTNRTGSAGDVGTAILVYTKQQIKLVEDIKDALLLNFSELPGIYKAEVVDIIRGCGRYGSERGGSSGGVGGGSSGWFGGGGDYSWRGGADSDGPWRGGGGGGGGAYGGGGGSSSGSGGGKGSSGGYGGGGDRW
ncbi:hypothetical protein MKW98_013461, partial [Papaver atlanticum]